MTKESRLPPRLWHSRQETRVTGTVVTTPLQDYRAVRAMHVTRARKRILGVIRQLENDGVRLTGHATQAASSAFVRMKDTSDIGYTPEGQRANAVAAFHAMVDDGTISATGGYHITPDHDSDQKSSAPPSEMQERSGSGNDSILESRGSSGRRGRPTGTVRMRHRQPA